MAPTLSLILTELASLNYIMERSFWSIGAGNCCADGNRPLFVNFRTILQGFPAAFAVAVIFPDTDLELADTIKSKLLEIELPKESGAAGKQIVDLGSPKTALISIIKRNGKFVTPSGSTVLNEGDILLIIYESQTSLKEVYEALKIKPETDPTPDPYFQR